MRNKILGYFDLGYISQISAKYPNYLLRIVITENHSKLDLTITTIPRRMQIRLSSVPSYLRGSPYFLSFASQAEEEEGTILVPQNCFKASLDVSTESDLINLLDTIRFWLVPELIEDCVGFLRYALNPANLDSCLDLLTRYEIEIPHLTAVRSVLLAPESTKMKIAAETGATRLLRYMYEKFKFPLRVDVAVAAASNGHIECLRFLLQVQAEYRNSSSVSKAAAGNNQLACLKLIIREGGKVSTSVTAAAAKGGHIDCLKYLHGRKCPWDVSATRFAAHYGHLDCLRYAIEEGCKWRDGTDDQFYRDVRQVGRHAGQRECLQYLCEVGFVPSTAIMTEFASLGHVDCIQFLLGVGCPFDVSAVAAALRANQLDCVKCMAERMNTHHFENAMPLCNEAAKRGLSELLMYFRGLGCPWGADTVHAAAATGSAECLAILISNGCDIHTGALVAAASAKSLSCMILLSEAGCPWSSAVLNATIRADDADCLEYALHHCPYDSNIVTQAIQLGGINCLRHLHTIGILFWTTDLPVQAVELGNLAVLTFLHESGCPWDERTCTAAAVSRNAACFNYAYAFGCPGSAVCANNMLHMRWLHVDGAHKDHFTAEAVARASTYPTPLFLRYLHELNIPWDGHATIAAARDNRVDNLKYLRSNGCMWDENAFRIAVVHGHLECVRYMFENNCPFDFMQATNMAAQFGHIEIIKYMRERRLPWSTSTCAAAAVAGHLACLVYLHGAGCPWDHDTCIRAGTVECYMYAAKNGCPGAHLNPLFSTL